MHLLNAYARHPVAHRLIVRIHLPLRNQTLHCPAGPRVCRRCIASHSKKVREGHEHGPYNDEQNRIRNEIRENHQTQAAKQRNDRPLAFSINEKPDPDRAK